jgi:hypothetical protein
MKKIIFTFCCILFSAPSQYSQTLLLKVGNAIQYSYEWNEEWIVRAINKVETNSKEYIERKGLQFWIPQNAAKHSFERIDGDSAYYVLTAANFDSLIFNFNWKVGHKFMLDSLSGQRIDSINVTDTFLKDDTLYLLRNFHIDPSSGDTSFDVIPEFNHYSKKLGRLDYGLWWFATGAKVAGVRYGEIYPFSEEIYFANDSIYLPTVVDTGFTYIVNSSDYLATIDSIISIGAFYGYRGYFNNNPYQSPFFLWQTLPSFQAPDTLGILLSQHDSIKVSFYDVDLCPICKKQLNEYFEDTLKFVFTFTEGNAYSFSRIIPIF